LVFLAIGMFQLTQLNLMASFWTFVFVWMVSRGALAFLFVPINVTAFAFVPKERMNNATGMINLARNIGGSVGISLVTTLQSRLTQRHQVRLIENLSPVNPQYMAMLHGLTAALRTRGSDAVQAVHQAQALLYGEMQRQAAMLAFIDVFWIMGMLCLAMIPLMFILKDSPKHGPSPLAH
jgi:DHA2 family multidrug resistance protein